MKKKPRVLGKFPLRNGSHPQKKQSHRPTQHLFESVWEKFFFFDGETFRSGLSNDPVLKDEI